MKMLSLKLRDEVFKEVEKVVHVIKVPRNAYINMALIFYNKLNKRKIVKKQLHKESKMVRDQSLQVLQEFEALEDDIFE
jgi:hypothetical protein